MLKRKNLPSLTVAVATVGARIFQLDARNYPQIPGVEYRFFVQQIGDNLEAQAYAAEVLSRPDMSVTLVDGIGVARNRNAALISAKTDLLVFADDDLTLLSGNYEPLRRFFAETPKADFCCGRVVDTNGLPRKRYGRDGEKIGFLNCARVGTPEIAVRMASINTRAVRFDEAFGAGTNLWLGDEFIFLADCLRAGLRGQHVAIDLAMHPKESSGTIYTPQSFEVRRAVLRRALGKFWRPALLMFAIKHRKRFATWSEWLHFVRLGR